jgi:hypothetical protein
MIIIKVLARRVERRNHPRLETDERIINKGVDILFNRSSLPTLIEFLLVSN